MFSILKMLHFIQHTTTLLANTIQLPKASLHAGHVDPLHDFLVYMSLFFTVAVGVVIVAMIIKYHRSKKNRETAYIENNHLLEWIWTIIPLIILMFIFAWGYKDFVAMRKVAVNPIEISVVGRQWLWNFEYANGRKTMNEIYLPKGKPVKLIMTAEDVLHSFYVPNFRVKQDVVPATYTYISFEPTELGIHPVYCAEFCGTAHSDMLAKAIVLESTEFEHWLEKGQLTGQSGITRKAIDEMVLVQAVEVLEKGKKEPISSDSPTTRGQKLFSGKAGCIACHSFDGSPKIGPTVKGIFGKEEKMEDGQTIVVNENYLRESIVEPNAKVVKGFPPSMSTYKGVLSDQEIKDLIEYIKSLK